MKFAENIIDIPNAFNPNPLNNEELNYFYCKETMSVRTGDEYMSPIEDIYDACKRPTEHNAFLLLGHKGCGKSTELNHMSARLREDGYQVFTIECGVDLDLNNPLYADLLILMGEALLKIANRTGCVLDADIVQTVKEFWSVNLEKSRTVVDKAAIQYVLLLTENRTIQYKCRGTFRFAARAAAKPKSTRDFVPVCSRVFP